MRSCLLEKWVDVDYPARSGLKAELEAAGYSVTFAWDSKLAKLELKGSETVIEPDSQGVLTKYRFDEVGPHRRGARGRPEDCARDQPVSQSDSLVDWSPPPSTTTSSFG